MTALTTELVGPTPGSMAKYEWVKQVLLDHIDKRLTVGDPVPSERELSEAFGVARMTARRALDELVTTGRVVRIVGRGTFVAAPTIRTPITLTSFTADMQARGHDPGSITLTAEQIPAGALVANRLGIQPKDPVFHLERVRTSDGAPLAIARVHIPVSLAPDLNLDQLATRSLYEILATDHDIIFDGGEQVIGASAADERDAQLLRIEPGAPLLHFLLTSTYRGQVAESTDSVFRADRYELTTRF